MSYFERIISGFLIKGEKTTVDPTLPGGLFPVQDWKGQELLQGILTELKMMNVQLAEITGEELNSNDYED